MDYKERLKSLAEEADKIKDGGLKSIEPFQPCFSVENCTPNNATLMVSQSISGWDRASFFHSLAISLKGRTKTFKEQMESIAYLDLSADILVAKGIKDSSEARKRVVDQQEDVVAAKDLFSRAEALEVYFNDKMWQFKMAYDACKKVGMNDPSVGDNKFGG
jgi:hypothetical protein